MPVNDLTFNQAATLLNSIVKQATGRNPMAVTNANQFVSVGQTALKAGYDPLNTAISQMTCHTIFSVRPYSRKFKGLQVSNQRFGAIARKLNTVDSDWGDDKRFSLVDGESIDMYEVKKPNVLQLNYYGANIYSRFVTVYKDQLDNAFCGPEDLARFFAMIMTNVSDQIEQAHETLARATLANFIAGKIAGDEDNVIHLVTEYNDISGLQLDSDTVKQPENWAGFAKWAASRIKSVSKAMTERTTKFHINVDGKPISRHTPVERRKMYLYAPYQDYVMSSVFSSVFNPEYLNTIDYEEVNFWQSIDTPDGINVNPIYLKNDGTLTTPEAPVVQSDIFGVIFDEEALGYTVINQWSMATPMNAAGGYSNYWYHFTDRYWNDFTENGVVLLLD